jgi:hypothetical protein
VTAGEIVVPRGQDTRRSTCLGRNARRSTCCRTATAAKPSAGLPVSLVEQCPAALIDSHHARELIRSARCCRSARRPVRSIGASRFADHHGSAPFPRRHLGGRACTVAISRSVLSPAGHAEEPQLYGALPCARDEHERRGLKVVAMRAHGRESLGELGSLLPRLLRLEALPLPRRA